MDDNHRDGEPTTPIRELAAATAKLLGYTLLPQGDIEPRAFAVLQGPDEIQLFWHSPWRPKGRIAISGQFPKWGENQRETYNPRERPSITIAASSSAEHAVREITRRLLPVYVSHLEQAKADRTDWHKRVGAQARTIQRLQAAGARPVARQKDKLDIVLPAPDQDAPHRYGDMIVCHYYGTVNIDLRNLSAEQAVAVLRALMKPSDK